MKTDVEMFSFAGKNRHNITEEQVVKPCSAKCSRAESPPVPPQSPAPAPVVL